MAQDAPDAELIERVHKAIAPLTDRKDVTRWTYHLRNWGSDELPAGSTSRERSVLLEVTPIGSATYYRLIEKDGKPLREKDAVKEQKRYDAALRDHKEYAAREHVKGRLWSINNPLEDLMQYYQFKLIRSGTEDETPAGTSADVIEATPIKIEGAGAPPSPAHLTLWIARGAPALLRFEDRFLRNEDMGETGSVCNFVYASLEGTNLIQNATCHLRRGGGTKTKVVLIGWTYTNYRKFIATSRLLPGDADAVSAAEAKK